MIVDANAPLEVPRLAVLLLLPPGMIRAAQSDCERRPCTETGASHFRPALGSGVWDSPHRFHTNEVRLLRLQDSHPKEGSDGLESCGRQLEGNEGQGQRAMRQAY